jgi:hypothetical protein
VVFYPIPKILEADDSVSKGKTSDFRFVEYLLLQDGTIGSGGVERDGLEDSGADSTGFFSLLPLFWPTRPFTRRTKGRILAYSG